MLKRLLNTFEEVAYSKLRDACASDEAGVLKIKIMRHLFFMINFGLALLCLAGCVYSIGAMESPASFMGGIIFFVPTAVFAAAEWLAWYRERWDVLHALAVTCCLLGGFAVFGVVVNVAEAIWEGWPGGFGWFVVIGLAIAGYFFACGILRLRSLRMFKQQRIASPEDSQD